LNNERNILQKRSFLTEVDSTIGYVRGAGVNEKYLLHNPAGEEKAGNNTSAFKNLLLADYPMVIVEKEKLSFN